MKRIIFAVFALAALALSGCTLPPLGTAQTPTQIAAQFCPSATIALTSLQGLDGISAATVTTLADAAKIVTPVCAAGAVVQSVDLKTIAADAIPVIISIVKASTLEAAQQNPILLDLAVAQIAIASLP